MSSLEFHAAGTLDLSYQQAHVSLKTADLLGTVEAFQRHMDSIWAAISLPAELIFTARCWQDATAKALRAIFGSRDPTPEETQQRSDELSTKTVAFMEEIIKAFNQHGEAMTSHFIAISWAQVEYFTSYIGERQATGLAAALSSATVQYWTAYEAFTVDLWTKAVNLQPESLVNQAAKSHLPKGKGKDDAEEAGKNISIKTLQKYRFDLRAVMGDVLRDARKFDFNSLFGIGIAFKAVFDAGAKNSEVKVASLFDGPDYQQLQWLEAVRNLIVHRGRRVDETFRKRVKGDPRFSALVDGELLTVSGSAVAEFGSAVVRQSLALLGFVDNWLSDHPK